MNDSPERQFKGVWIPWQVWENTALSVTMKCLWATVDSLGKGTKKACTASNLWLAERMQMTEGSVANTLGQLRKLGYIDSVSFDGRKRGMLAVIPAENESEPRLTQGSQICEGSITQKVNPEQAPNIEENKDQNKEKSTPLPPEGVPDMKAQALEIYQAYPLKVGKPKAVQSILKALKDTPFAVLLAATQAFARARGSDLEYCPHPSTWFNQQRYADDPKTWNRSNGSNSHSKSLNVNSTNLNSSGGSGYSAAAKRKLDAHLATIPGWTEHESSENGNGSNPIPS